MTITYHTNLSDIVDSETIVNNFIGAMSALRNDCTFPRVAYLRDELAKPAISGALIAGKNDLLTGGRNVQTAYGTFHKALAELQTSIKSAAINQEKTELKDLIDKVTKKIDSLEDDIDDYNRKIKYEEDEEKIADYRQMIRDIRRTKSGYESKKEAAIARLNKLGEEYVSTAGAGGTTDEQDQSTLSHTQHSTYKITEGDTISLNGTTYEFWRVGKTEDGTTYMFYKAAGSNEVFLIDAEGNVTPTGHHSDFPIFNLYDEYPCEFYTQLATSDDTAAQMGLPPKDQIGRRDETLFWGEPDTYVQYGEPNPSDVAQVTTTAELHQAVADGSPVIVIDATHLEDNQSTLEYFLSGSQDVSAIDGSGSITLVYDQLSGKYYPMDANGGFAIDYYVDLTPEKLSKFTIDG